MELVLVRWSMRDLKVLYGLLEERTPDQSISHKAMPSFDDHCEFVANNPYLAWYFIVSEADVYNDQYTYVGAIYITHRREIGLHVSRGYQRKGYGKAAVRELMSRFPGPEPFLANINPKNEASIAFWKSLGFELLQVTYAYNSR